ENFKLHSSNRRILLWGGGGAFQEGYVLVMSGVAVGQLTPALKPDAGGVGLLGAGTLGGLFAGTSLFGYSSDKVGRREMLRIDI
ncbi:MFS transporter, partial [Escherichia coli]|nr:MFS transporter [Escherichia coli]